MTGPVRRSPPPLILLAVLGLVLGAAAVGGAWWLTRNDSSQPALVRVDGDRLPDTFAGVTRDDVASEARKPGSGAQLRARSDQLAPALSDAYGGSAYQIGYGLVEGKGSVQVLVADAVIPSPLTVSDGYLAQLGFLGGDNYIDAPGTPTTRCVTTAGARGMQIGSRSPADEQAVTTAKKQIIDGSDGWVVCVRSDTARRFSIQVSGNVQDSGQSVGARATALAQAADRLWDSLVG